MTGDLVFNAKDHQNSKKDMEIVVHKDKVRWG